MGNEITQISPIDSPLRGQIELAGDKSVSFRAIIFGAIVPETSVRNLALTPLLRQALKAVKTLGCSVKTDRAERILFGGINRSIRNAEIDCGGSATLMRLLMGLLAGIEGDWLLRGDDQLSKRPMERVSEPLRAMGATVETTDGYPPVKIKGGSLTAIDYELPIQSAQLKSAILMASLSAHGQTMVIEKVPTRDHTERMLIEMGARITTMKTINGVGICIEGGAKLKQSTLFIPGDVSSAAYIIAAALLTPGSDVSIRDVLLNPTRTAYINHFRKMGADIDIDAAYPRHFEPYGNLLIRGDAELTNAPISNNEAVGMMDEMPLLAVVGAFAKGRFEINGMAELRVKESDRIASTVANLRAMGITVEEWDDGFAFDGGAKLHPAEFNSFGDHRMALACKVAGMALGEGSTLAGTNAGDASFPDFNQLIGSLQSGGRD